MTTTQETADVRRKKGSVLNLRAGGRVHQSACGYDIELFHKWLGMSIREGSDRIKIVAGIEPGTYVVTVLDKKET